MHVDVQVCMVGMYGRYVYIYLYVMYVQYVHCTYTCIHAFDIR